MIYADMICIWLEKYIINLSKYQSVIILFRAIEVTLFFMLGEI